MGRRPGSKNKPKDQTMPTKTADKPAAIADEPASKGEVAIFSPPRLPYHPAVQERFSVDKGQWKVLCEAIYPAARTADAIVMVLSYCKSRNMDPFKRPVHIVPVYDSARGAYIESVWPGISELRTTASRTKGYAGCDEAQFGPNITMEFKGRVKRSGNWEDAKIDLEFPEWCRITVYRFVEGQKCKFVGPKVKWLETYATQGPSELPNKMWEERTEGQLEKCAEAAALRRAFPEELGNELTAEEMIGRNVHDLAVEIPAIADQATAPAGDRDTAPPRSTAPEPGPGEDHAVGEVRDGAPPRRTAAPKDDPITSGPQRTAARDAAPKTKPVEPFKLPGTGETFESWAEKYIDHIKTSPDTATVYKWIDVNSDPLGRLTKGKPSVYAAVKKATEGVMEKLRDAQAKAADKTTKAAAKAKPAEPPPSEMDAPSDMDGDAPDTPTDPETVLAAIDRELAAVENPDDLQGAWESACEPLLAKLDFPPDQDLAQACFDKHSRRLGGD